jgi:predicted DNA-binding transcriptional regulator AlpA
MRVLIYRELKSRKGIPYTRVHLRRLMAADKFPKCFNLGENTIVWDEEEIDRHLADQQTAARTEAADTDEAPQLRAKTRRRNDPPAGAELE